MSETLFAHICFSSVRFDIFAIITARDDGLGHGIIMYNVIICVF